VQKLMKRRFGAKNGAAGLGSLPPKSFSGKVASFSYENLTGIKRLGVLYEKKSSSVVLDNVSGLNARECCKQNR